MALFDIGLFAQSWFSEDFIMEISTRGLFLIMLLSAPMLMSALCVGLVISIIQATTQVQEQTLASVPKMGVTFVSLIVCGPWIMDTLSTYARELFQYIALMGP
jgi:flagellar biosynthesis protein FliQ